jgi:hypothetical protein
MMGAAGGVSRAAHVHAQLCLREIKHSQGLEIAGVCSKANHISVSDNELAKAALRDLARSAVRSSVKGTGSLGLQDFLAGFCSA